ncbi:MAG: hypothetical protein ABSC51_06925 [Gaiellaceae bacterium]
MDDSKLSENGHEQVDGVICFESQDDGAGVLAYAHATEGGHVSLAIRHELDGELEIFMDPKTAEELALALARASDEARRNSEREEI